MGLHTILEIGTLKGLSASILALFFGINEGVDILKNIYNEFEEIKFGQDIYKIIKTFSIKDQEFGMTKKTFDKVYIIQSYNKKYTEIF